MFAFLYTSLIAFKIVPKLTNLYNLTDRLSLRGLPRAKLCLLLDRSNLETLLQVPHCNAHGPLIG